MRRFPCRKPTMSPPSSMSSEPMSSAMTVNVAYVVAADGSEGLQRFRLARAGVADYENVLPGVVHGDLHERSVKGQPSRLHHADIMQREDHLFQITEIAELVAVGDGRHQHAALPVFVEHRREFGQRVEGVTGNAEQVDGVGPAGELIVVGDFEEIAQ